MAVRPRWSANRSATPKAFRMNLRGLPPISGASTRLGQFDEFEQLDEFCLETLEPIQILERLPVLL